ncbi:hypothetical protein HYU14_04230 [Candidatus Woesearchaeota archaeon]|nr:hypothetical protein [Candidatus Woesearchaeota archaeon]
MSNRRAELEGQIFIYVLAIIIFAFILLYGYRSLAGIREKTEQVSFIKFKTDFISSVKRVAPDFGTEKREEFFIGGDYQEICFVRSINNGDNYGITFQEMSSIKSKSMLIADVVENNKDSAVPSERESFFLLTTTLEESFAAGYIDTPGGFSCLPIINGRVKIKLEGKGNHAYISGW